MSVSVIGLGKLGLPLVATLASRRFDVIGYDSAPGRAGDIRAGRLPREPGLGEALREHAARIELTADLSRAAEAAVSFVVVPTPSVRGGAFSLRYARAAFAALGAALRGRSGYHVVALVSTVLPGDMEPLRGVLEEASGRRCGADLGLCYNPAFIALGDVARGFLQPDFVLIGESDARAGDALAAVHRRLTDAPVRRMSFTNAEIAKIALNTFVTTKISFGNTLARLCERLPGGDVDAVTGAIGLDRRIGGAALRGGLGFGGPCFPRDNRAFAAVTRRAGMRARIAEASDRVNDEQLEHLRALVRREARRGDTIALLGLAYKPGTDVIEASQPMELARSLVAERRRLVLSDPMALDNVRAELGDAVRYEESAERAVAAADVVVLSMPWPAFAAISDEALGAGGRRRAVRVVIDCWRQLAGRALPQNVRWLPLGRVPPATAPASAPEAERAARRRAAGR